VRADMTAATDWFAVVTGVYSVVAERDIRQVGLQAPVQEGVA